MPKFLIRQLETYVEDFVIDADDAEQAIDMVDNMEVDSVSGPKYVEATNTYLLDQGGSAVAKEQPDFICLPLFPDPISQKQNNKKTK